MAKVMVVANQKGGVGKTTTAVNLSACIAENGKLSGTKVLAIDIDPQGNMTSGLGAKGKFSECVYDVIINGVNPENVIVKTAVENLDIIPAEVSLSGGRACKCYGA